jgi:hypothetical protein
MDIFYVQGHLFFHTISRKVQFRTFAPVLDRKKETLLRETRAVLALYQSRAFNMNPTGNAQGDFHFMSLTTGKRLSRHQWTEIPMTNAIISSVESMTEKEGQPLIKGGVPLFEW